MSQLIDDVKTGLKGIRGAGDALRGGLMEAADQTFDSKSKHPELPNGEDKNRTIKERGKADMKQVDEMFARREWDKKNRAEGRKDTLASKQDNYTQTSPANAEISSTGALEAESARIGQGNEQPIPKQGLEDTYQGSHEPRADTGLYTGGNVQQPSKQQGIENPHYERDHQLHEGHEINPAGVSRQGNEGFPREPGSNGEGYGYGV